MGRTYLCWLPAAGLALITVPAFADQGTANNARPEDTEVWAPSPPVVVPSEWAPAYPPSDAIVLFDGLSMDEWVSTEDGRTAAWTLSDGVMTVDKATGSIRTRRSFRDFQLHIEWRIPTDITGSGQDRGNSGVFLAWLGGQRGYELQILDSYENETYVNGMAGSVYKQAIPLANASRRPGEWQSYDVVWTAPRFSPDGGVTTPARITAFFNGVLVQDGFELAGETVFIGAPTYTAHREVPIMLQAHRDPSQPISFRNIWLRELS